MNVVQAIELENIVYFKEPTRFEFQPGLTFIQGRNMQRRGPSASNGSGKSLLFGVLPNLLFDTHPTITKNTRSVQKQIYGKGSVARVEFAKGKHKYQYEKAGSKTRLSRDGKDLQSRVARDQIRTLIDLSEEEFFSTVYLDSRRNNQFQLGTSADRFAFITELFRLQDIDDLRKHVNRSITELNSDGKVLEQTLADLEDLKERMTALPKVDEAEAQKLSEWLQTASARAQRLGAAQHQWDNWRKYSSALAELQKQPKPRRTVKELAALVEQHVRYQARLEQQQEQQTKLRRWQKELSGLKIDETRLPEFERRRQELRKVECPEQPKGDLVKAQRAARIPLAKAERIAAQSRSLVKLLSTQLADFDKEVGDSDTCPTCHSQLTASTRKAIRERFTSDIAAARDKQTRAERVIEAHEIVDAYADYERQEKAYRQYKKERDALAGYDIEAARRKIELQKLLKNAEQADSRLAEPEGDHRELVRELKQARAWREQQRIVESMRVERPDEKVDAKQIEELNREVSAKMSQLPELQASIAERKALRKQRTDLVTRQREISQRVEDLPVYKLLSDAYSVKGIKTLMVQRIATALEKNLNRYSRQIFAEDFRFTFEVADNRFNVWVTRKVGRREVVSDIRHMSGAESRLFIFLFVLSLLPLIPDRRRMNILVLDEPDANMDPDTREIFRDSLLPRLAKVVPSVVVISPNRDIVPHHSRVLTVVKNKGESKLVEGFV